MQVVAGRCVRTDLPTLATELHVRGYQNCAQAGWLTTTLIGQHRPRHT